MLSLILASGVTFYYHVAELPLSLAVFSLFVAWLSSQDSKRENSILWQRIGWAILLMVWVVIASYGQIMIGAVFLWFLLFEWIREGSYGKTTLALLIWIGIWFGFRYWEISQSHLSGRMEDILSWERIMLGFTSGDIWGKWLWKVQEGLWLALGLMVGMMVYYLWKRQLAIALYMLLTIVGYSLAIMCLADLGVLSSDHYLMLGGVLAAWPFLHVIFAQEVNISKIALLLVIISVSMANVFEKRRHFEYRQDYLDHLITTCRTSGVSKTILWEKDVNRHFVWTDWSLAMETLLKSALEGAEKSITVYVGADRDEVLPGMEDPEVWLGPRFRPVWDQRKLPQAYFSLPEEPYVEGVWPTYER